MFSGIIEEVGVVKKIEDYSSSKKFTISCKNLLDDASLGDSVSVNGACLTITQMRSNEFDVDIVKETLDRTNLKHISEDSNVNLERAMKYNQRVGGHLVQGHIDGLGKVVEINQTEEWTEMKFELDSFCRKYCIFKGSIAIDGVSLTIAEITPEGVKVALIPHTLSNTILSDYKTQQSVNIETDMVGKFIENFSGTNR
tara:strand:+ start:561 stop:1154 length:594 start_codon:yes stop_codon:yes gene_type:complete